MANFWYEASSVALSGINWDYLGFPSISGQWSIEVVTAIMITAVVVEAHCYWGIKDDDNCKFLFFCSIWWRVTDMTTLSRCCWIGPGSISWRRWILMDLKDPSRTVAKATGEGRICWWVVNWFINLSCDVRCLTTSWGLNNSVFCL